MVDNIIFLDAVPSLADDRDFRYSQKKLELKDSVDLREWDTKIENQGSVGSCVGNAITNAYELMVRRLYPEQFVELSSLFVYYNSRLFDNSIKDDTGTYIRDGLKAAARYGVCSEILWPFVEDKFDDQPTPKCYVDGSQRLITRYETLYTLRDLLEILNNNNPIIIGMALYEDFMDMNQRNSVVKLPNDNSESIGNHAVIVVGYDLQRQLFLAKNSFGSDWGDKGYFWIPFEYMRTNVFEKWCFDISSQNTVDIDMPISAPKSIPGYGNLLVETGSNGIKIRQRPHRNRHRN